jgi:hypothetical protein
MLGKGSQAGIPWSWWRRAGSDAANMCAVMGSRWKRARVREGWLSWAGV